VADSELDAISNHLQAETTDASYFAKPQVVQDTPAASTVDQELASFVPFDEPPPDSLTREFLLDSAMPTSAAGEVSQDTTDLSLEPSEPSEPSLRLKLIRQKIRQLRRQAKRLIVSGRRLGFDLDSDLESYASSASRSRRKASGGLQDADQKAPQAVHNIREWLAQQLSQGRQRSTQELKIISYTLLNL
jgi:hypothetical protein